MNRDVEDTGTNRTGAHSAREPRQSRTGFLLAILLVVALAAGTWFVGTHHFVMTRAGLRVYPKGGFALAETYVDMRAMPFLELRHHLPLVRRMIAAGDAELLPGGAVLQQAREMGMAVVDAIGRFADETELAEAARDLVEKSGEVVRELDERYHLSETAGALGEGIAETASTMGLDAGIEKTGEQVEKAKEMLKQGASRFRRWLDDD